MTRIVLLGAPGSGKGTQAQRLQAAFAIPQVSSGDLLRDAVARGTDLGLKAKAAMDAGRLVSDDIVLGLIRERLGRPDAARGFLLDGFPRNAEQAAALEQLLAEIGQPLDAVVLLDVGRELLHQRLAGRRTCRDCGRVFNVFFSPPGTPPHCERCDDEPNLFQRPDDREDVIDKRLEVYEEQTRPLIEHYGRKGLLQVVKGEGALEDVFARMQSVVLGAGATVPVVRASAPRRIKAHHKPASPARKRRIAVATKPSARRKTARRKKVAVRRPEKMVPARTKASKTPPAAKHPAKTAVKPAAKPASKSARKTVRTAVKKATRKPVRKK